MATVPTSTSAASNASSELQRIEREIDAESGIPPSANAW